MLDYSIGQGYSALDAQAWRDKLDGYAVASGLGVSVDTGLTLSVAAGTATVGETGGSVDTVTLGSATSVTLATADTSAPRKDTVYIDAAGTVQVETGTPEAANPGGNSHFDTFEPEPPIPSTDGVILAEVWVGAGAASLSSTDIRDRRVPADVVADRVVSQSVDAGEANNTLIAKPGEVQSKIDELAGLSAIGIGSGAERGVVSLTPTETYDEGEEIHVKPGVTLDFNGATMTHSADHNLVFLDNGGYLFDGRFDVDPAAFTSDVVLLDTTRSTHGKYTIDHTGSSSKRDKHAKAEFTVLGDETATAFGGTGLALRDSANVGITMGCIFEPTVLAIGTGVELDAGTASSAFVNVPHIDVEIVGCETLISHVGTGAGQSHIQGGLQPLTGITNYGIRNQSGVTSVLFEGSFWDPSICGTYAVAGFGIRVLSYEQGPFTLDGSAGTLVETRNLGKTHYHLPNGDELTVEQVGSSFLYSINGAVFFRMNWDGDMWFTQSGKGPVVTTPDGAAEYRIRVDNSGDIVTEPK